MRRIGFLVAGTVLLAIGSLASAQSPALTPEQRAEGEAQIKWAAQEIANTARDPSSVAFRRVFLVKRNLRDGRQPIELCGEINGKNGYGGFTGYQAFTLMGGTVHVRKILSLDVARMCEQRPDSDTRDYAPEMKAAFDHAVANPVPPW